MISRISTLKPLSRFAFNRGSGSLQTHVDRNVFMRNLCSSRTVSRPFQIRSSVGRQVRLNSGSPTPPPQPEVGKRGPGRIRRSVRAIERLLLYSAILGAGAFAFVVYTHRHPTPQVAPDPNKKTLVILGSGWGSTATLKGLDTSNYNVIVVSPRNYFMFTPLLPSCTTGTIELRSIMEPIRHITRMKRSEVQTIEAECTSIDPEKKTITISDASEVRGDITQTVIPFDYLIIGIGAENQTFGIKGVREHGCFLKEIEDAQKIRTKIMDCVETAIFKDQTPEEKSRLLHTVVVGGGPTGIEFAAELQDFFQEDLRRWYPEIADEFKVTLVEALPSVLPMFSKKLIDYTESTFKEENIDILTKTMVQDVSDKKIVAMATKPDGSKEQVTIPYGLLVWAAGNTPRQVVRDLINKIPEQKGSRRGLLINDYLVVQGTEGIWALGDCTSTKYAPTAQAASQQGIFLAKLFNQMAKVRQQEDELASLNDYLEKMPSAQDREQVELEVQRKAKKLVVARNQVGPFHYSHQGSLAYIGSDKAIAELEVPWFNGNWASGGGLTYLFWRSAYLSQIFSIRLRTLVVLDWLKAKIFGRDVSRQ